MPRRPDPSQSRSRQLRILSELWAIAVALQHEAVGFLPKLSVRAETRFKQVRVWEGQWGGKDCLILCTGMGPGLAYRATRYALQEFPISHLLSTGYCGGLKAGWRAGDAVLPSAVQSSLPDEAPFPSDPALSDRAAKLLQNLNIPVHRESLVTVSKPALKTQEKEELAAKSGAGAVDMESYSILRAVQESGKKIASLTVRFVVDALEDELADTRPFFTPEQGLRPLALMGEVLRRPKILLELPGLEQKAARARASLTPFVSAWIEGGMTNA